MKTFDEAYAAARDFTLIPREKLAMLWQLATVAPPGDFVEVGVYKGGSAMILQAAAPTRRLHVFDTFTGHPPLWEPGVDSPAHYAGRYGDVDHAEVLERLHWPTRYIYAWDGVFSETWLRSSVSLPESPPVALAHVDVDLYQSTRDALEAIVPRLAFSGALVVDDYGVDDCPGATKACDEYELAPGFAKVRLDGRFCIWRGIP